MTLSTLFFNNKLNNTISLNGSKITSINNINNSNVNKKVKYLLKIKNFEN